MNQTFPLALDQVIDEVKTAGLMQSLCTIQVQTDSRDGTGQRIDTWTDLAGHVDIECMAAPDVVERVMQSLEVKMPDRTGAKTRLHVLLDAYYPEIRQNYRAHLEHTVNSVTYERDFDIVGVEADSQHTMTRLAVEEYSL